MKYISVRKLVRIRDNAIRVKIMYCLFGVMRHCEIKNWHEEKEEKDYVGKWEVGTKRG